MVFDECDYLEKTVESLKDPTRNELDGDSKPSGMEYPCDAFRHRERSPSRLQEMSSSRHREPSSSRILEGLTVESLKDRTRNELDGDSKPSGMEYPCDAFRHRERSPSRLQEMSSSRHREPSSSRILEGSSSRHRSSLDYRSWDGDRELHHSGRDDPVRDWDRVREKVKEMLRLGREWLEREREISRRSRSHSERHHEEERERERQEKSKELREGESDRESRRSKESKEVAEPEADPERDQRTGFAFQIALKADERDVYDFFSRAGKVRDVRLIMDRNSRRSKGVGYIEFYDALSVPMAIALSGQLLLGQPVMVKPSEAEKNLVQSNTTIGGANGLGPYSGGARRLYVGNLHFNMTEEQLRLVFEPFGPVEMVQLPRDLVTGFCKGYGFIQFQRLEDARAVIHLNGQLEIAGRSIKVSAVTDQVGLPEVGANTGDLDDDEGGGLSLNVCSRALLMQKLDRTGTVTSIPGALLPPVGNAPVLTPAAPVLGVPRAVSPLTPAAPVLGVPRAVSPLLAPALVPPVVPATAQPPVVPATAQPVDTVGIPSECLLLKNMFDPAVETEPDFDLDIKEDAEAECAKHGTVKHIFVDKNSAGHVYLRFDSTSSAMSARRALNGRWFAGNTVTAIFLTPQNYEARFPSSC